MQCKSDISQILRISLSICILFSLIGVGMASSLSPIEWYSYNNSETVIESFDPDTFVPIDDGTKLIPVTGWGVLEHWKPFVLLRISDFFDNTPFTDFINTTFLPMLSILLSGGLGYILLTRSTHLEPDPTLSPGKILACVTAHPGCRQAFIVRETGCSRGSVAYHLYRLQKGGKIHPVPYRKQTHYYAKVMNSDSVEHAVISLIESEERHAVFCTVLRHPGSTRYQIAELLDKSPDTVSHHLGYFPETIISTRKDHAVNCYTITPEAAESYDHLDLPKTGVLVGAA